MPFSEKALDELRRIYRDEFGEDISRDEAAEMGDRLVRLVRLLLRPLPKVLPPPGEPRAREA